MREEHVEHGLLLQRRHVAWHVPQLQSGEILVAAAAALLPLCLGLELWKQRSAKERSSEAKSVAEPIRYFDLWRCICVACVVVTHCWEGYHQENAFAVGQWVLQFLVLISGTCFARSSSSVNRYCWRLLLLWSVGTLLNWCAIVAVSDDWRDHPERIQFQMGFCMQILGSALAVAPLKWHLTSTGHKESQDFFHRFALLAIALYVFLMGCGLTLMLGYPHDVTAALAEAGQDRLGIEIIESAATLLFATLCHCTLPAEMHGWIGWVMLLFLQGSRVAHREPRPGSELHLNDLYTWAAFIFFVPLKNQSEIGLIMAGGWPIWALACAFLLGLPGTGPPFPALYPSAEVLPRARFYAVETVLVLSFVTIPAAGPQRTLTIPRWMGPALSWLNILSLAAFVTHKAILTLLTGV